MACSSDEVTSGGASATGSSTGTSEASSSGGTAGVETSTSSAADTTTVVATESSSEMPESGEGSSSAGSEESSSTGDAAGYLDEVVPGPDLLEPRGRPILLRLQDGSVYVGSGYGSDYDPLTTIERFRPVEGDVVPAGELLLPRYDPCAVVLADGRVLTLGNSWRTEIWDPTTETSEEGPPLNYPAGESMCMVDGDGAVYVADSWTAGKGYLVERWAPGIDEEFVELPSETELSYGGGHAGALFGDGSSILLTGGDYLYDGDPPVLPRAPRVYDIASGVFSLIQGWDGDAYLLVEDDGNALLYYTSLAGFSVSRLDHATMMLDDITPIGEVARAPMAAIRTDGIVVFAGGYEYLNPGSEAVDPVVLFDPDAQTLTPIGTLAAPRRSGAALRLDDGTIAIVGGAGPGEVPLATIEIYR